MKGKFVKEKFVLVCTRMIILLAGNTYKIRTIFYRDNHNKSPDVVGLN